MRIRSRIQDYFLLTTRQSRGNSYHIAKRGLRHKRSPFHSDDYLYWCRASKNEKLYIRLALEEHCLELIQYQKKPNLPGGIKCH